MKIHFPNQKTTLDIPKKTLLSEIIRENFGPWLSMACGGAGTCGKCSVRLGNGRNVRACQTFCEPEMEIFLDSPRSRRCSALASFAPSLLAETTNDEAWEPIFSGVSLAFDLGTTTLAAALVRNQTALAAVARPNPQTQFGADVISRIDYGNQSTSRRKTLQATLLAAVCEMAEELGGSANLTPVDRLIFAGNTAMEETALGLDLASLASAPFEPSQALGTEYSAGDSVWNGGLNRFLPETRVLVFPVVGAFVGGDVSAGLLAIHSAPAQTISFSNDAGRNLVSGCDFFLDLGTNGEMVLETPRERFACATAAGPCFEGARISCGMRAETGAIVSFENRDGKLAFETFDASTPEGICGSALIDLTAELLALGLLTPDGRLLEPDDAPQDAPTDWKKRILKKKLNSNASENETLCFQVVGNIHVTQEDFRELQLAVGAIRTGIRLLLMRAGISASMLQTFRIAGGFGKSLRIRNAQRIGLIPASIPETDVHFLGNSSLAGAVCAAVSKKRWETAMRLARETLCLDLAQDERFSEVFMDSMFWEEF